MSNVDPLYRKQQPSCSGYCNNYVYGNPKDMTQIIKCLRQPKGSSTRKEGNSVLHAQH